MFRNTFRFVVIGSLVSGCVRYVPRPIDPPVLEQSYRARTLADPNLQEFFKANSAVQLQEWPPQSLDLDALTVLALYFSPDLDEARSRIAAAEATIATARVRPNPSIVGGGGYTDAEQSPWHRRSPGDRGLPREPAMIPVPERPELPHADDDRAMIERTWAEPQGLRGWFRQIALAPHSALDPST